MTHLFAVAVLTSSIPASGVVSVPPSAPNGTLYFLRVRFVWADLQSLVFRCWSHSSCSRPHEHRDDTGDASSNPRRCPS